MSEANGTGGSRAATAGADAVRQAWAATIGPNVGTAVVDDLLARHAEPHRRYHTAEHVMWVLHHVDGLLAAHAGAPLDRGAIVVAALFHDAVYEPRSAVNEAESARLAARQLIDIGWSYDRIEAVTSLILATAGHEASDPAQAILLDADLAILGAEPPTYDVYVDAVRAEYDFVDDVAWRTGRAAVLGGFLERPRIFSTPSMAAAREQQARDNLRGELARLQPASR